MRYGHFDPQRREYVITDPRTPVKWINYIGTRRFGGFVDHTGGALICKDDPTFNRITKYVQQLPASDFKGEGLYLRIKTAVGYKVFSPFYVPTLDPYDRFECHVGLGYSRILSVTHGLEADVTIFVPPEATCEIRDVRLTNVSSETLEVDVIPLVEYTHPNALIQFTNADWAPQTMVCHAVEDADRMIVLQYPFMHRDDQINYLTSNRPASSYETDRKRFLGDNEYGSYRLPLSLRQSELSSRDSLRGDNIGALLHHLGSLAPGESRRVILQLGQSSSLAAARSQIERFRQPEQTDAALAEISAFWDRYLSALQVATPDSSMNAMLNVHNPHQCYVTLTWSRYLSTYQLGMGARGIGVRDSSQDIMAVAASVPDEARSFLITLLSFQLRDGSCIHQFNPLTLEGNEGDSLEMEDRPHYYSDDHLWEILAVAAYLKETGDMALLDERVPFYDRDRSGAPLESGCVMDHLQRGLSFTKRDVGQHGFPLLGFADWNDTVNLPAGAESLFTACLYGKALLEMIELQEYLGLESSADQYRNDYATMRTRVEDAAWDGEWYVRYFDIDGTPRGSRANLHGRIYLNAQSWAVISGFAAPERGREAMDSVYAQLKTPYGLKLTTPGLDGYDPQLGGISTYPPGAKENGGILLHPNPWAIIAECLLGNGDRAYEYYAQINPASKNDIIEIYECEPYVYAQNILGDEHPQFGLARNSWLTGTAAWVYQAATQWLLGVRPTYHGLRIDPCIPRAWERFTILRRYRGAGYDIHVENPGHVCRGIKSIVVDSEHRSGDLVPTFDDGRTHMVLATLGR
jgi:cellobiose phosphorylase